jgi:hypothetical protein
LFGELDERNRARFNGGKIFFEREGRKSGLLKWVGDGLLLRWEKTRKV